MEQPEIENPTLGAWRGGTSEKHGDFVSKYGGFGRWSDCPRCLERPETCEKHGLFTSKHVMFGEWDHWSGCQKCAEEEKRAREEREKQEQRDSYIASMVRAARIPDRFFLKTLADYEATTAGERDALSVAKNYGEEFADHLAAARCLVFCGSPGTGKTHLACAIAKSVAQSGRSTRYFTVQELIRSIRATWQPGRLDSEETVLRRLREVDLLVLDEVGVQFGTEAERTQLTEVMDMRYRAMKPTLVVSNCTRSELKKYLGERIADRLRENDGKVVIFDWPSRRGTHGSGPLPCNLKEKQSGLDAHERTMRDLMEPD
jgi:DNA replication protein DnaC